MNTTNSERPGLQIINRWFQNRVQNPTTRQDIAALHTQFIENTLARLTKELRIAVSSPILVTVRSSFRKDSPYLRPVYSQPDELQEFFVDPKKQEPFRFPDKNKALRGVILFGEDKRINAPYAFSALYKIHNRHGDTNRSFAERINRVHARWLTIEGLKQRAGKVSFCFFAGRNKSHVRGKHLELGHIMAVYYSGARADLARNQEAREAIHKITQDLFDGLDLISHIDARNFEAEGLQLVAQLLPEFSREDIAPADKIAFAVERLGKLLSHHMIGRHGGAGSGMPAKLFYIATSFERQQDHRRTLHPRLEVYPHVYRKDHVTVSFFVTHRSIPSATKFLLWRYLKSQRHRIVETTSAHRDIGALKRPRSIRLSPRFEKLLQADSLGTPPLKKWQEAVTPHETPDFLFLSQDQTPIEASKEKPSKKTPWEALNRPAEPGCLSIAAFVVEGRVIRAVGKREWRCLPRGIFAIESHYEDGFSDDDIDSLRLIFKGLASLIRLISHQHAPIDYRSLIAATFKQDAEPEMRAEQNVLRLLFLVQKLDAALFHELLPKCLKAPETYDLDVDCLPALEKIASICPGRTHPTPPQRAKILQERMKSMQALLSSHSEVVVREFILSEKVLAFLEACPENFTWASYLACMAQTLGDRIDAGTERLPQFTRMVPGFSASGMFIAMVDREFRQVVKLSTADKIRKEAMLYRKWVRYRLVNAARIPLSTGLAFETTGEVGRDSGRRSTGSDSISIVPPTARQKAESEGVLVSDLVSAGESGEDTVRTFLDIVAERIGGFAERDIPSTEEIEGEIKNVFGPNAKLWMTDKGLPEMETMSAVLPAFRIPKCEAKNERRALEKELARLGEMRTSGKRLSFESLLHQWGGLGQSVSQLEKEHFHICHGDLNARNLTWAEGLRSFFLIDFEHVGPAPNGTDQFRLIVNLLTELWVGLDSRKSPQDVRIKEFKNLHRALADGLDYLKRVFEILIKQGRGSALSDIAANTAEQYKSGLPQVLKTILMTVDPYETLHEPKWRFHWALMLLCAATKEFSYTCRTASAITLREAQHILNKKKLDTITIPDLEEAVKKCKPKRTVPPSYRGDCMYHFVAGRLLLSFANALDNRGND